MKKYLTLISLFIFALLLIGCNTHEHYYEKQYVDPTCIEPGTIIYTCECNDSYTETVSEPLGHLYGEWEITKKPTINIEGSKEQKCSRCNNINTEQIEKREYPDLGGYTIKIAQAEYALQELDPFLDFYVQKDKEAKQRAWKEVEELFNCKIEVVPYPENAEWGPSRINYILKSKDNPQYDFYYENIHNIDEYVRNDAILNLDDFYELHGNNLMNNVSIESGSFKNSLYSFSEKVPYVYHIIAYNLLIFKELQAIDSTLEEPAKIFNDGNWTLDVFIEYCEKVQTLMAKAYGTKGEANSKDQEYFAISGYEEQWWSGLATGDEKLIIDSKTNEIDLDSEYKKQSAEVLKSFYQKGIADKHRRSLRSGDCLKTFFISGDTVDVSQAKNWDGSLRFYSIGYVPWPRPNDTNFGDSRIAIDGVGIQFIMASGRDYSQYGEECTAENIYWAIVEMYNRTKQYYEGDDIEEVSGAYLFDSDESKKAIKYIYGLMQEGKAYYEPYMSFVSTEISNENNISTTRGVINQYCVTNKVTTWDEAIEEYLLVLKKYLQDNYQ